MSTRGSVMADRGPRPRGASSTRATWRRLVRHRLATTGGALTLVVATLGLVLPLVVRADPTALDVERILTPPSHAHWFGTDDFGRDLLVRVVHGIRLSLLVGSSVLAVTPPGRALRAAGRLLPGGRRGDYAVHG